MSDRLSVDAIIAAVRLLSVRDKQRVHREVARIVAPIYARTYRGEWEIGMAASRDRVAAR